MENPKLIPVKVEYIVNEKKKTVTAIARFDCSELSNHSAFNYDVYTCIGKLAKIYNGIRIFDSVGNYLKEFYTIGVAKCNHDDTFNIEKGKRIAESKATIKAFKFYNHAIEKCFCKIIKCVTDLEVYHKKWQKKLEKEIEHHKFLCDN